MEGENCARCGKAAELAPCYSRDNGNVYHYQCIMINVPIEKPFALEPPTKSASLGEFERTVLVEHNKFRFKHDSCPLVWSKRCADHAKLWVDHVLKMNEGKEPHELQLQHDSYKGMGENLYLQSCGKTLGAKEAATRVCENWYSEEPEYDYSSNSFNYDTSHFSQLVWDGTWKMGAATGQLGNVFVTVANYWPAGNIQEWFLDNVKSPIGTQ